MLSLWSCLFICSTYMRFSLCRRQGADRKYWRNRWSCSGTFAGAKHNQKGKVHQDRWQGMRVSSRFQVRETYVKLLLSFLKAWYLKAFAKNKAWVYWQYEERMDKAYFSEPHTMLKSRPNVFLKLLPCAILHALLVLENYICLGWFCRRSWQTLITNRKCKRKLRWSISLSPEMVWRINCLLTLSALNGPIWNIWRWRFFPFPQ